MKIAIGNDHSAVTMKSHIAEYLRVQGHEVIDFGTESTQSTDYPIYAEKVAKAVVSGDCERGILICGTGIGISIAANKVRGVRCAHCSEPYSAKLTRQHNDANILAFGARTVGPAIAETMVDVFLATPFDGGRHQRRVDMIAQLEEKQTIE